jgi:hypothetical protein
MRPQAFRIKVDDFSPSPRKHPSLVPCPHTGARYPMSEPMLKTCTLSNTGQTSFIFIFYLLFIFLPPALQFVLWGLNLGCECATRSA